MKKKGFTIAEALITVAIVGVVASLIIPTFISDYGKQVYAKSLSVAVSNFETAIGAMMIKENVSDLRETEAWINMPADGINKDTDEGGVTKFVTKIGNFLVVNNTILDSEEYYSSTGIKTIKNVAYEGDINSIGLLSKNNQVYWISVDKEPTVERKESEVLALGGNLTAQIGVVNIDVNGELKSNTFGRDIFTFNLGVDGKLYPVGGIDSSVYSELNTTDVWNNTDSSYKCLDGSISSPGFGCTARLVENDYKMDY